MFKEDNRDFKELRACDIEDLIQSVLNELNDINKRLPRNNKSDNLSEERRKYYEKMLEKLKEVYSAKGLNAEEYIEGVKSNIAKREARDSREER